MRNKHKSEEFIEKAHQNIIEKLRNLDKIQDAQIKFGSSSHMVQDIIEDFVVLANKLKLTGYALSQIDIMKDYQDR